MMYETKSGQLPTNLWNPFPSFTMPQKQASKMAAGY